MNYTLRELLDIQRLQDLLDSLNEIHQVPSAIIDTEGTILTATAWQDICTQFHRVNTETAHMCRESDRQILSGLGEHSSRVISRCPMGLIDAATAIIIEGHNLGSIFTGQFLMEPPDEAFFIQPARFYGFDCDDYLDALRKVPLVSEEQLAINLNFIEKLTCMLAEQGLHNKRLLEAKAALRESEARFRSIFDQSLDAVFNTSPDGTIINANPAACRIFGMTVAEFQQVGRAGIMDTSDLRLAPALEERLCTGRINAELTCIRKNGERFPVEVSSVITAAGEQHSFVIIRDIAERKRAEEKLLSSEASFRAFFEQSAVGTGVVDISNRHFVRVNKKFCDILGYSPEELHDVDFLTLTYPDDCQESYDNYVQLKAGNIPEFCVEKRYLHRAGHPVWVMVTVAPLKLDGCEPAFNIVVIQDISGRKQAEEEKITLERQLLHTQKLESLGILAGGIAHDFNNLLTAIIGNVDMAQMRISKTSAAAENLLRIEHAAVRAADLTKQMLAYSGKGKFIVAEHDLNTILEEMLHMLEVSISKKAALQLNLSRPLPNIEADATQMRQIIMNLVINASEAIGDKNGIISVSTGYMECDRSYLNNFWLDETISTGIYVSLEVSDNGCGMCKETLAKLFDPFFTTKFTGRGLGMAAVLGIVRGHKGAIRVYSEESKGTTFKILLPATFDTSDTSCDAENLWNISWHGSGTVLIVDDEETVRDICVEMLTELGFNAISACDGNQALDLFRLHSEIAFVILDLTMPSMDGAQCFRELRRLNPDVKVVMSSGYNQQEVTQKFAGKGLAGFVQKPYRLSELIDVIKSITI